jgi:hypothetical protein
MNQSAAISIPDIHLLSNDSAIKWQTGWQPRQTYWSAAAIFAGQVTDISIISHDFGGGHGSYRSKLVRFSIEESLYFSSRKQDKR